MKYRKPIKSYTIWFSQRTGSTLLYKALESTQIAGRPNEWLSDYANYDLISWYKVSNHAQLQEKLWSLGITPNGVFGLEVAMCNPHFLETIETFRQFPTCTSVAQYPYQVWEAVFPNHRHIFMTRRNKVRQAVSWWKAIKAEEWHRIQGEKPDVKNVESEYLFEAIDHLFAEISMRECAIQEFFDTGSIVPLTIVYEDFIADYENTVKHIIEFLEIPCDKPLRVSPPFFEKLADDISDIWTQRYRQEKQKDWPNYW